MILPSKLLDLIEEGENHTVEFKKSTTGTILGIHSDCINRMKKDFVTAINNENKMYPPLYLTPLEYEWDGKSILYIHV